MLRRCAIFAFLLFFTSTLQAQELRGLLIGISEYRNSRSWGPIHGVEDAQALLLALQERLSADPENFRLLLGPDATKQGILSELSALEKNSRPGDTVLLYYSGHGSVVPDEPQGDEKDGLDECLVPFDAPSHRSKKFPAGVVTDDVFKTTIQKLRNKVGDSGQVLLLFDSCHSGTMNRAGSISGHLPRTVPQTQISQDGTLPEELPDRVAVLSACQADEVAADDQKKGAGVFTQALLKTLNDPMLKADADYRSMMQRIHKNGRFLEQNPRFEGQWDLPAFGSRVRPLKLQAKLVSSDGRIDKGELFGLYLDSRVRIGKLKGRVVEATPWNSRVQFERSPKASDIGKPVELISQSSGASGYRVFSKGLNLPKSFESCPDPSSANLLVSKGKNGTVELWDTSGQSFPVPAPELEAWLKKLTTRFYLNRLVHRPKEIDVKLRAGRFQNPNGANGPEGFQARASRTSSDGITMVRSNEHVELSLVNNSSKARYVQVLNFLGDGTVTVIDGSERYLEAGESASLGLQFGPTAIFDEGLKIVASDQALNFDAATSRSDDSPLSHFFSQSLKRGEAPPNGSLNDPESYSISETILVRCSD